MTFNQIEYFCAVCRYRSISRASDELFVSQPTISVAIRELEKEFNLDFFIHGKNRITLTADGEQFYEKVKLILSERQAIYNEFSTLSKGVRPIRIGIPPVMSIFFFPRLLNDFQSSVGIPVRLYEYGSVRACRLVENETLDAALVNMDFFEIRKLNSQEILSDITVFYVSYNHKFAGRNAINIDLLRNEDIIMLNTDSVLNNTITLRFRASGIDPHIILYSSQLYTIFNFIRKGNAGAFLYSQVPYDNKEFLQIPLEPEVRTRFGIIWRHGQISSNTMAFIDFIRNFSF